MVGAQHLGEFQQLVLISVMALGDNAWSSSIAQYIQHRRGTPVSGSVVHATLKRLTEKGLLASRSDQPEHRRRGRRRQMFTLTDLGLERLEKLKASLDVLPTDQPTDIGFLSTLDSHAFAFDPPPDLPAQAQVL